MDSLIGTLSRRKEFFKSCEGFSDNPIHSDKHLEGAGRSLRHFLDEFKQWHFHIPSNEVIWLEKNSNYMQGLKSAILAIFQNGPGWPCHVSTALKNSLLDFKNYF